VTYRDATVGVVVPAYNEEAFVGDVVESVPAFVDRVYPVDDSSTDDTWSEITAAAARVNERRAPTPPFDRVVVPHRHDQNQGAGGAAITGYREALADGVDVVASIDGDGQMDPQFLPAFLDPVVEGRVAYAKGDRLAGHEHVAAMPRWRLFGNLLLTGLTRVASGYWRLRDPQNGYTVISREALAELDLDHLYERYGFLNDVLVHLSVDDRSVADVSHPAWYGEESSGIQYRSFVPRLSLLLTHRFVWRLRRQARRRDDRTVLATFIVGLGALAGAAVDGAESVVRSSGSTLRRWLTDDPPEVTDGGTDQGADAAELKTTALAGVCLCFMGAILDRRGTGGRVVRVDGHPRADQETER
jgi:glycosyltransferase involved in cell wall biosynthesis